MLKLLIKRLSHLSSSHKRLLLRSQLLKPKIWRKHATKRKLKSKRRTKCKVTWVVHTTQVVQPMWLWVQRRKARRRTQVSYSNSPMRSCSSRLWNRRRRDRLLISRVPMKNRKREMTIITSHLHWMMTQWYNKSRAVVIKVVILKRSSFLRLNKLKKTRKKRLSKKKIVKKKKATRRCRVTKIMKYLRYIQVLRKEPANLQRRSKT